MPGIRGEGAVAAHHPHRGQGLSVRGGKADAASFRRLDGTVRRVETEYDGQGNAYRITTYDASSGGSIVNQVQREFNGLGQLTKEYQAVSGAVNTGSTPTVQYAYSFTPSGSMNHSRLTSMTYPNGRVLSYSFAAGLSDDISRRNLQPSDLPFREFCWLW